MRTQATLLARLVSSGILVVSLAPLPAATAAAGCAPVALGPHEVAGVDSPCSRGNKQRGDHGPTDALREVRKQLEVLEKRSKEVALERRAEWEIEQSLEVAKLAVRERCEWEVLEMLLRCAVEAGEDVPPTYSTYDMPKKTLTALAWLVLERRIPGHEREQFLPGPARMPGPPAPGGVLGVLRRWSLSSGCVFGVALAAIDTYHDERARDLLIALSTKEPENGKWHPAWTRWALEFVTSYDPRIVKPMLETTYNAAQKAVATSGATRGPHDSFILALRSCLEQVQYIESLDRQRQDRYQRILRVVARAKAVAPQGMRSSAPDRYAVMSFARAWQQGDEYFLPFMLQTKKISGRILAEAPISPKGVTWLRGQSQSGDWAAWVKEALRKLPERGANPR